MRAEHRSRSMMTGWRFCRVGSLSSTGASSGLGERFAETRRGASIFGLVASRGPMAAYNASKGALVNLTRHLAAQWGARGVLVNAPAPGYFPTELTGGLGDPAFVESIEARSLLVGSLPSASWTARSCSWRRTRRAT